jgi:hypothetical protein
MKAITKHLIPNAGTLILVGLLFLAQGAGAIPGGAPAQPMAPSQTLLSYQGTLTDPDGNPIDGTVAMEFALYDAALAGSLLWGPESQSVEVSDGLFHVLLGSVEPIDPANLTGDLYLNITVNGEGMSPRELITSIAYAIEAETLPAGATTRGSLTVNGPLATQGTSGTLRLHANPDGGDFNIFHAEGGTQQLSIFGSGSSSTMDVEILDGNLTVAAGNFYVDGYAVIRGSNGALRFFADPSAGDFNIYHAEEGTKELSIFGSGSSATMDVELYDGDLTLNAGNLDMNGNSIINCGALTEANLQTPAERIAGGSPRFEEGDVLCWSAQTQRLEKCGTPNDPLVQAVADTGGRPIVIGAEAIKVLGPVRAGDYLVASEVPGYAMVSPHPTFGTVIAQALEDFDGEQGIIKAMIRKF